MIAHASALGHGFGLGAAVLAVGLYGLGWLRRPTPSRRRLTSWLLGVLALIVATWPATERWAEQSFTGHMTQHLLLISVAAPLLVLAQPLLTIRLVSGSKAKPTRWERVVARWWRTNGAPVAAVAFVLTLYLTHLTGIYDLALRNNLVHDVEHLAYLSTALLLWSSLHSGARQVAFRRVGAVFGVIGASAFLGVVLLAASAPLIDTYAVRLGDKRALDDQRQAASLMWIGGMATTLPLLILAVWNWAATEQRIVERTESFSNANESFSNADSQSVRSPK